MRRFTAESFKKLTNAIPFVNNSKPIKDSNFANLKTECAFKLRDLLDLDLLYCEDQEFRKQIMTELESIWLGDQNEEGKVRLQSKKKHVERSGSSPNFFDSIMMRMRFELKNLPVWD